MGICCIAWETQTGLCINLEGWDGEGDEREFQKAGIMYTYGWFMLRFCRKQQNFIKQLSFKKKKKQIIELYIENNSQRIQPLREEKKTSKCVWELHHKRLLAWTQKKVGAVPRWQSNMTGRPLSSPQIHQKIIWMLSNFHKTISERWQKTPGT